MKKLTLFIAMLMTANMLFAQIIHIPADYPTIQQGINAADNGDTVLVQPGIYQENLTIEGKNIVLASLFLTSQDTSYISQTVIDANQSGRGIRITYEGWPPVIIDSTCVVSGFTIINGMVNNGSGGGVLCEGSSPTLSNLVIKDNQALTENEYAGNGGGIASGCYYVWEDQIASNPVMYDIELINNTASNHGGAIFHYSGNLFLNNVHVKGNTGNGAVFLGPAREDIKTYTLQNIVIEENNGDGLISGDIDPYYHNDNDYDRIVFLGNSIIKNNLGAGLINNSSNLNLSNVSIRNNQVGIKNILEYWMPVIFFDSVNRSNIYNNSLLSGKKEIESDWSLDVILDTFMVLHPNAMHVKGSFTFDIQNGYLQQIESDVYVSPEGDDSNSGLSPDEPFKTIYKALFMIDANESNSLTIHLAEGTYSQEGNGEFFPFELMDYVSLSGASANEVIIDGTDEIIRIYNSIQNHISDLTVTNGINGFYIHNSQPVLENVIVTGNSRAGIRCSSSQLFIKNSNISENVATSTWYPDGGGICLSNSTVILEDVLIENNYNKNGGGIYLKQSSITGKNVSLHGNSASNGGGIYCEESYGVIQNLNITNNTASEGAGVYLMESSPSLFNLNITLNTGTRGSGIYINNSTPFILNSTIAANSSSHQGGGIYGGGGSTITLMNSILWNNAPSQVRLQGIYGFNSIDISFSDVQGGYEQIEISGTGAANWLEGNINEDPLFAAYGEKPYQLSPGSPCIDAGTPDTTGLNLPLMDLLGNLRIWDGDGDGIDRIDMGAYEYDAPIYVGIPQSETGNSTSEIRIFPNPFTTHTTIEFSIPKTFTVSIQIFNAMGTRVAELHHGQLPAGQQHFTWHAGDLPKGLYFCRVQAGKEVTTRKIIKY
mgnify:CR=1 FL=1